MAKRGTSKVTPRLRFPEFRSAKDWTTLELRQLSEFVTERVGTSDCTPYTVSSGVGLVSQQEKLGRTIAGNSLKNYIVLQKNDFAYNKSATKAFPQGFIARYVGEDRAAVPNSIFTCFRTNEEVIDPAYLDNLFSTNLHGNWLRNRIAVGARAHGSLNVSDEDLMDLLVPLPAGSSSFTEQKRIADCLTSLDEVIAAQERKVEALKAHKRGLMHQLFPREGETRPRLRFPEFRDAPEWEERRLDDFADISKGKGISKADIAIDGVTPCVRYGELYTIYGEIIDQVHSRTNVQPSELIFSEAGDVIIPGSGETKEDIATCAVVLHGGVALGGDLNIIRADMDGRFFSYYLNGSKRRTLARVAQGDAVVHLYPRQLGKLKVSIPSKKAEQRRIADLFSSLDAQIAAETNQLAALKTHKLGLMQQLFPVPKGN